APVLDLYLHQKAKQANKKIIGIETVAEQLGALNSLSYQEQADLLRDEVDSAQANKSGGPEVLNYYLAQDRDSLSGSDDPSKKSDKFYKALVVDRNERMAKRMAEFIKKQPTFIAIGALHLPGEVGVIALLRKKGFTVEPVL
ncbi:TraB/GumN family protein, partial [uncultured Mucilaginibacter sp.]|uniref:TraB/GumN family protein n=1 Tax=uncultured Mucilaginibacter sp. TaxID=797541 RepID=UPI0025D1721D